NPAARLAFLRLSGRMLLYVDGQEYDLEPGSEGLIEILCARRDWAPDDLAPWLRRPADAELLTDLLRRGVLEPGDA
ncbi:MAG: hypothetical protein PVF91_14165, partial [Chromatiales bacterium]